MAAVPPMAAAAEAAAERKPNVIVVFTDDQGWADLGAHGVRDDVKTPHLDALAAGGALMRAGYITAPQCSPSRAGLITGRYQEKLGFDNISKGPLLLEEVTLAERLRDAGYATGMIGKWHLEPNAATTEWSRANVPADQLKPVPNNKHFLQVPPAVQMEFFPEHQGFTDIFKGELDTYWVNYGLDGEPIADFAWQTHGGYRIDTQTAAAEAFIERHPDDPFFLYLNYYAPHVPMEATPAYLERFPGEMAERRRYGLAMMAAVDDGVGRIVETLDRHGLREDTLIFYISDNGAPLLGKEDLPISFRGGAWDGSLNDPWAGEKGMLTEGGIRVPYIVSWPGRVRPGQVIDEPVIALDVAPTALAAAGEPPVELLDGIDLLPHLAGDAAWPERPLYWRFWGQAAVRDRDHKFLRLSDGRRYLFDMNADDPESASVHAEHPEVLERLEAQLSSWTRGLQPAGLPGGALNVQEREWFGERHLVGVEPLR
ncbi:sulfatase family protein [Phycisphaera mikurensis]|uniref:Putative sulfatase n=1 Tax=Phycisphaera mikurensis (strain NBRC 102666 / KCTC 22515 / FYK2301M01) TaxID=1142394 RepID=I0IFC4_PHYMF|nr:sulfatase-like hydrolase/transferase [Phycisphaera mikurensis]MBB6440645.1 arylsulfatase A-like enzyme [Phycisphaera mikurensis]BAM03962.1 putative sulfatase [Phycisphaera mikurensis NBRC 102666]